MIIALALTIIVVKVVISFDINKWQESRLNKLKVKIRLSCPHVHMRVREDDKVEVKSLFYTPFGTTNWICTQCGSTTPDKRQVDDILKYYAKNINAYNSQMKKTKKLYKKIS
ncbi:MAG: hypothetical protein OXG88_07535 [Gammaproteobacteria bacterium]|nr:hypothetical protein [Gammaproteobacteria bacterium]